MHIQNFTMKSMDKKKNILFILHLPPPVHGSSLVGQTIRQSKVINSSFECRYINTLVSRSVNETGKKSFIKVFRFVAVWFQLLVEIIKKKPDICYLALTATGAAFYKDVLLVGLLKLFNIKRIYHLHNKGVALSASNKINKLLYQFVFKNAEVILLSNYLYNDIESFVPSTRVHICPNGIEDTVTVQKPRLKEKEKSVKILFLSNLIESKGVLVLLKACEIISQKGIDFECDFVGAEGDLSAKQFNEKVSQMQLTSKVNYLGKKFGNEKQNAFATADIFAFPTYYSNECFPLVLLEAMCNGLPVISTFEGGIPDIVEQGVTGFLISQKDENSLADKLEELIRNQELRQKMGSNGRKKFETEFKQEIFEKRMIGIIQKTCIN